MKTYIDVYKRQIESALSTSFGAGIENQIKLGIIIIKNNSSPQISKLNL